MRRPGPRELFYPCLNMVFPPAGNRFIFFSKTLLVTWPLLFFEVSYLPSRFRSMLSFMLTYLGESISLDFARSLFKRLDKSGPPTLPILECTEKVLVVFPVGPTAIVLAFLLLFLDAATLVSILWTPFRDGLSSDSLTLLLDFGRCFLSTAAKEVRV